MNELWKVSCQRRVEEGDVPEVKVVELHRVLHTFCLMVGSMPPSLAFLSQGGGGALQKVQVTHFVHPKFVSPVHKMVYILTISIDIKFVYHLLLT